MKTNITITTLIEQIVKDFPLINKEEFWTEVRFSRSLISDEGEKKEFNVLLAQRLKEENYDYNN